MAVKNDSANDYSQVVVNPEFPRLPLSGLLDLTYRCNLSCRHCWLNLPAGSAEKSRELSYDEILHLVQEARKMGCREWALSGGEPMLREDFTAIFDFITSHSASYSLNTNGTLITPAIARLMKRPGDKMVALYGATAEVHDHVTRVPGSFEATMRGMAHLRQVGAGFTVQLVPMQSSIHQFDQMVALAQSLSPHIRVGAPWLWLRADGDRHKNEEIKRQRLSPPDILRVNETRFSEPPTGLQAHSGLAATGDALPLFACLDHRDEFHIDAYGGMSFCLFIKNPKWRYDLRRGTFQQAWEEFIPALAGVQMPEAGVVCTECSRRRECAWCPAYAYLEERTDTAPITYLCAVATEKERQRMEWQKNHQRYFGIAGMTIRVDMPQPITDKTFDVKFKQFEVDGPGEDLIVLEHFFHLPQLESIDWGEEIYSKPPWAVYKNRDSWIYKGILPDRDELHCISVFNRDHSHGKIYHPDDQFLQDGNLESLSALPTDQIFLARALAERQGCYLHSAGVIYRGRGFVFAGHSGAGKSTTVSMIQDLVTVLCDDRMIVRKHENNWKLHGSWSHGDIAQVSSQSAPLSAILFLVQSKENRLERITDPQAILHKLLAILIKPLETADWWEKMLNLLTDMSRSIPCYYLRLDKSGRVRELLDQLE